MGHDITGGSGELSCKVSGRFLVRLKPSLHASLKRSAAAAGVSLNDFCKRRLAEPDGIASRDPRVDRAVTSLVGVFGGELLGVVAFGSWARGDESSASDLDLLVVLSDSAPVSRELYRRWDGAVNGSGEDRLEPHFVHFPREGAAISGVWAEVAIDGIILFERALELSRRLSSIRRAILQGKVVRKWKHGQPYWVEVA